MDKEPGSEEKVLHAAGSIPPEPAATEKPDATIITSLAEISKNIGGLGERLAKLEEGGEPSKDEMEELMKYMQGEQAPTAAKPGEAFDWENATMAEAAAKITSDIESGSVAGSKTEIQNLKSQVNVLLAAAKHEDFWEYKDAIFELGRQAPGITPEKAYELVKAQKVAADATKKGDEKPAQTDDEIVALAQKITAEKSPEVVPLGEKGVIAAGTVKKGSNETVLEDASDAYDEIFGR